MKKKIIAIGFVLLITVIAGATYIYLSAQSPLKKAEEAAISIAKSETSLSGFTDFQLYNGEETFYVMKGKDEDGVGHYIWIAKEDGDITTIPVKEGISEEEAIRAVYADRNPSEIIDVRLGVARINEKDFPAWEIYFRTENNSTNYYYIDFATGEKLRAIDNF